MITVVERCGKNGWYWHVLDQHGEIVASKSTSRAGFELAAVAQHVLSVSAYRALPSHAPSVAAAERLTPSAEMSRQNPPSPPEKGA